MSEDTDDLFAGIDKLVDPTKDDWSTAAARIISELGLNLRAAQHDRLIAHERLAVAQAKLASAEESLASARAKFDADYVAACMERDTARQEAENERAQRLDTQGALTQEMAINKALVTGTEKEREALNQAVAMLNAKVAAITMPAKQMEMPVSRPGKIDFEFRRDGANMIRSVTAHLQS